jgi:CheY-like chemotaxis protein
LQARRERTTIPRVPPAQPRILVVDDQATHRDVLVRMLERFGHRAEVAENGVVAMEMIAGRPFDLIFMDVQMPELGGLETTRRIRARYPDSVRIVGVSGRAAPDTRADCLAAGMDLFFAKPLTSAQLREVLGDDTGEP